MGFLSACGDSGYDDPPNDTQTPNTLSLTVTLDGSQQVPQPVQTAATGTAELVLEHKTGEFSGSVKFQIPVRPLLQRTYTKVSRALIVALLFH
jgi:hypothetical protein